MHDLFKDIEAVGFDLDGTLYKSTPEMYGFFYEQAAIKVLAKMPGLETIENAKEIFIKYSEELESGSKAFMAAGYGITEATSVMYDVLLKAEPKTLKLIAHDSYLVEILKKIKATYYSYLITKSPKGIARNKLRKIGIHDDYFNAEFFGDDPILMRKTKGEALEKVARISSIPLIKHAYVGDRVKADIIEPKTLGIKTIAVWNEYQEADVSIKQIHDIEDILL